MLRMFAFSLIHIGKVFSNFTFVIRTNLKLWLWNSAKCEVRKKTFKFISNKLLVGLVQLTVRVTKFSAKSNTLSSATA